MGIPLTREPSPAGDGRNFSAEEIRLSEVRPIRLMAIAGARPNFMKIAPLLAELRGRPRFEVFLVHSGQHYDELMSDGFFRDLGIRSPDVNLAVGSGSR